MLKKIKTISLNKFYIYTDHKSLTYLLNLKDANNRLLRWQTFLQAYNFEIKFIKGTENILADSLTSNFNTTIHLNKIKLKMNLLKMKNWKS